MAAQGLAAVLANAIHDADDSIDMRYATHVAECSVPAILAWLETVAGDAAVREAVAEAIGDAWLDDGHGLACQYRDNPHDVTAATSADAAVAALLAAVRSS